MRIPHTIPKVVLRAYARNLDPEALEKSYEGRLLRSEDPSWDQKLSPSLRDRCLEQIIDEYVFYVKYNEELNEQREELHIKNRAQWEIDRAHYLERKASFDQKTVEQLAAIQRRLEIGDDPNDVDADDDDELDEHDKPIKKVLVEPEKVPETYPDYVPLNSLLDQLWDEDRIQAVEDLDLELVPFDISVKTIPDDYFWERATLERWPYVLDCDNHGKSWRRLYMEKSVWEAIEAFHPIDGKFEEMQDLFDLVAPEIIQLKLNNLIPKCFGTPRKPPEDLIPDVDFQAAGGEEDVGFGDGEEDHDEVQYTATHVKLQEKEKKVQVEKEKAKALEKQIKEEREKRKSAYATPGVTTPSPTPQQTPQPTEEVVEVVPVEEPPAPDRTSSDHLDFGLILPQFKNLKVLTLVYELQDSGLDWEARLFQFTDQDCISLAWALAATPSLETFELLRSHLNDEQCKTLIREGLIHLPHLKKLNLSYNRLGDAGARAVARLITDENFRAIHTIHSIILARNKIYNTGAKALAWALTKNRHLTHMDLRCNRIGDNAGRDFGYALAKNKSLLVLLLAANRLTENAAYVFNKMLFLNTTLKELDLSSNDLGKKGGEHIALGIRSNKNILRVDVRLANIGLDFEYDVGTHLRKNRNRVLAQYSLVERDDTYPNEVESGILAVEEHELSEPEWEEEEDEEEEDEDEDEGEDEGEEQDIVVVKAPEEIRGSKEAFM